MTEIMTGAATPAQIGAYLVALQINPPPAHVLISSAKVLRSLAKGEGFAIVNNSQFVLTKEWRILFCLI